MTQPALGRESQIEKDGGDDGAGDEKWFQPKAPTSEIYAMS